MDTVEQIKGCYYKGYWNLKPEELWSLILIDAFSQHLEIEGTAAVMILAVQPWMPTRTKPGTAVKGTNVASILSRRMVPNARLPLGMAAYIPVGKTIQQLRFSRTNKIGAIIGRYVPWIGWAEAMWYSHVILRDTAETFNRIVAPKDRIQWTYF